MTDKSVEEFLNEMSALNNELLNSHRKLAKKSAEIKRLNKSLHSANEELQQFAFVASHDLKEPLRMVRHFMEKLKTEYASQLDEKANNYIYIAADGANRMRALIDDLLSYAQAGHDLQTKELTDIPAILEEIKRIQRGIFEEKAAVLNYGTIPHIRAFKTPLKILFQNLISNALKYVHNNVRPEININCKESENFWEFAVADNGIGISAENHDKIFQLFKRLHRSDQYPGTGMGLATCKKITDIHGGKIWVESEEGSGCTFHFTLSKT